MCENKIEGGIELALWRIPVHWTVGGVAEIEAPTLESALDSINDAPYPSGYDWQEHEFVPDDDIDYIRSEYNDNQTDDVITPGNRLISAGEAVEVIATGEICTVAFRRYRDDGWLYWVTSCRGALRKYYRNQIRPANAPNKDRHEVCGLAELF